MLFCCLWFSIYPERFPADRFTLLRGITIPGREFPFCGVFASFYWSFFTKQQKRTMSNDLVTVRRNQLTGCLSALYAAGNLVEQFYEIFSLADFTEIPFLDFKASDPVMMELTESSEVLRQILLIDGQ
jgi:hypothetical protein